MAQIICFADSTVVSAAVRQALDEDGHRLYLLPTAHLSQAVRQAVQELHADIILLEIAPTPSNLPLYYFLRTDSATRYTTLILLTDDLRLDQTLFDADALLQRHRIAEQLGPLVRGFLAARLERAAAA